MRNPSRYRDALPRLLREGAVFVSGAGQVAYEGPFLAVSQFVDEHLLDLAARLQARRQAYPAMLPLEAARRLGYFSSFPQLSTFATHFKDQRTAARYGAAPGRVIEGLAGPGHLLSPAVCYHTYHWLQDRKLPCQPYTVTASGICFRFEGPVMHRRPLERLWNFTMREIVFFGSGEQVESVRRRLMGAARRFSRAIRVESSLVEASDVFFIPAARGQRLLQRLRRLKYELRAATADREDLAVASFNCHGDFFGRRMNIRLPDGEVAHSGCAAFGLERWAYAFFCQNGLDPASWPARLRRYAARYAR
jgi:seryl-tRNA synthetase